MARAKGATKTKETRGRPPKYVLGACTRCGKAHSNRSQFFYKSQSDLFIENDRYIPVCKDCMSELYDNYKQELGGDKEAMRRLCMKFDIYWNDIIYGSLDKTATAKNCVSAYIRTSNLRQYKEKTYDTTLKEEAEREDAITLEDTKSKPSEELEISPEIVDFWGGGLTPSFYRELEHRLSKWIDGRDIKDVDIGEITVIKQICLLEVMINQDIAIGNTKSVEKNVRALDALLGSANLKPVQKKVETPDEKETNTPFGVWIRRIEESEPIPEPKEEYKDVDGIARYISVWFLGHLSKVLNINNRYSNLYEEEMARLTVERPEYEGYDDEEILEDIFDRAKKEAEIEAKRAAEEGGDDEEETD